MAFREKDRNVLESRVPSSKDWKPSLVKPATKDNTHQEHKNRWVIPSAEGKENVNPSSLGIILSDLNRALQLHPQPPSPRSFDQEAGETLLNVDSLTAPPTLFRRSTLPPALTTLPGPKPPPELPTMNKQDDPKPLRAIEGLDKVSPKRSGLSIFPDGWIGAPTPTPPKKETAPPSPARKTSYASALRRALRDVVPDYASDTTLYLKPGFFLPHEETEHEKLTLVDYNRHLRCLTQNATPQSAAKAEKLLERMVKDYQDGHNCVRPDGACYNSVINAFAQTGNADKAQDLLFEMYEEFQKGNRLAEPNVRVYTTVLSAWQKSKADNAPERCEEILHQMNRLHDSGLLPECKPDAFSYTAVLHCWADSKRSDAAIRAESLFRQMLDRFMAGDEGLRPDTIVYSNLLNSFTQGHHVNPRGEDILWEMVNDYVNGNKNAKPSIRNFNTVLAMWSKSSDLQAPARAEAIVQRLLELIRSKYLDVQPDPYTYSLLLKCWTTSSRSDALDGALRCLSWMCKLYHEGDDAACLDRIKYSTCISALVRAAKPEEAEQLLDQMLNDYFKGNDRAKPDGRNFSIVLNGWTGWPDFKDLSVVNGTRAEHLMRRMWELDYQGLEDVRPNAFTYTRIIICFKKENNPIRAEHLLRELDYLHKSGKVSEGPSHQTYLTVLNGWKCSRHPEKHVHLNALQAEMNERFSTQPNAVKPRGRY